LPAENGGDLKGHELQRLRKKLVNADSTVEERRFSVA
jgi:hypothetical protein